MNNKNPSIKNFFLKFSGDDFQMINKSGTSNAFVGIGLFVFIIFTLCCISGFSFLYNAFQGNLFLSTPIGIFWGLLIAVIYVFLIYTISPILLPTPIKKNGKVIGEVKPLVFDYNISFFLRYAFIIFIAIIVAQPLNVLLLKNSSERSLNRYKIEFKLNEILSSDSSFVKKETLYRNQFEERVSFLSINDSVQLQNSYLVLDEKVSGDYITLLRGTSYQKKLENLKSLPFNKKNKQQFDALYDNIEELLLNEKNNNEIFLEEIAKINFTNPYLKNDFERYKENITTIIKEKKERYDSLEKLIDKSNFYITSMKIILKENPISWFITLLSIFVFSFPIYKKYRIGKKTKFFIEKQKYESSLIKKEYDLHLHNYGNTLQNKIELLNKELEIKIFSELEKLKNYSPEKYHIMLDETKKEIADIFTEKYQFWKNPPFRTQNLIKEVQHKSEKDFLEFIYSHEKENTYD